MVFILYKLYVLLTYTYPTPKLSPHRRRCISIFPQKNSLCMIYKRFKLWGHWKCPHKSPSPCNTCHTHVIIQICVLINHINMHTHSLSHTHTLSLSLTLTHTISLSRSLSHTHTHTHTHTHKVLFLQIFQKTLYGFLCSPSPLHFASAALDSPL